ncbi:hypothetical protein QBC38DRAFT_465418 [Podospora fimiseda]|uniref:Major facilitator superfamily (MFS) profile domain-containing protein n=1 Tax=Podospora fimiseda TaxID=252190 RepID=A0AAN7BYH5_9PEZI|nr:hypothetical protein QBC38DRAFT_465418 [Podospora fimiseda]
MANQNHDDGRPRPKLPVQQLAILAIARFAEPLALTSVFPYLPEMIASFNIPPPLIARYAGITAAIFSITQSLTAVFWGRLSDSLGRKPTILLGLLSTMICFLLWGLSSSLKMAIIVRGIMGAGNGNVGIIRTMVAEMVREKELQPKAFSVMPLVWSVGSVFGPAFGGFFARPCEQFPGIFGESKIFREWPFLLPNLMACAVFAVSFGTGLLFLRETLESKRHQRDWGLVLGEKLTRPFRKERKRERRRQSFVDAEASAPLLPAAPSSSASSTTTEDKSVSLRDIFAPQTSINLLCYTFLALHSVAYDQILPVFLNYPRVIPDETNTRLPFKFTGGFGLSSDKIGTVYTVYGIACGLVQFFLFPWLCARFGVLNLYRFATVVFPVLYFILPYTALIQDTTLRYTVFLFIMLCKGFVVIVAFPCTTILLTNSASSLRILGTLNGVATTFSGLGRALGPAAAGAVFSWGVQRGYVISAWWFLGIIALIGTIPPWFIVEDEDERESNTRSGEEDERESLLRNEGDEVIEAVEAGDSSEDEGPKKKRDYGTVGVGSGRT